MTMHSHSTSHVSLSFAVPTYWPIGFVPGQAFSLLAQRFAVRTPLIQISWLICIEGDREYAGRMFKAMIPIVT